MTWVKQKFPQVEVGLGSSEKSEKSFCTTKMVGLGKTPLFESVFDPKPQVSLVSSSQSTSTTSTLL